MVDRFSISWYNTGTMAESYKPNREGIEDNPPPFLDYLEQMGENAPERKGGAEQDSGKDAGENSRFFIDFIEQMGEEPVKKEKSAAEKRNKWTGKEVGKMGLGIVGGGAALGFLSVNHITKFLLRKVKGAGDFVNSWEWMEQTILGTKQRA